MQHLCANPFFFAVSQTTVILIDRQVKTDKLNISKRSPWAWVPTLYMAEGIPYVIVMAVATVMYQRLGLSNAEITLYTSWLYLPWVIKPFWSPVVELLRTKRWWIIIMQLFIGAALGGLAFTLHVPHFVQWSLAMLWVMAFSSATHDIAADGFYMLALNEREQAFFVGIRSTFYRVASILGQGLLCMLAGALESMLSPTMAWSLTFAATSALFLAFFLYHALMLPKVAADGEREKVAWANVADRFFTPFVAFFRKPHIVVALCFILLYRLPEALLVKVCPLFLLGRPETGGLGLSTGDFGMVQGTIGVIGLTLGGILGGVVAEHGGLKRWLWPMVASITIPDVVYIVLAYYQPDGIGWVSVCVFFEQLGYGFGFTAYMLYLLHFSRGELSTAHYSFCTGFMALGMMIPGLWAGWLQEKVGYLNFFIIVICLCLLTFIVAYFIPLDDEPEDGHADEEPCEESDDNRLMAEPTNEGTLTR